MQAIATEIIVGSQNADIQKLQPQARQIDYSSNGKSFAEILAARMNEMGSADSVNKAELSDSRPVNASTQAAETVPIDEKKLDEPQNNPKSKSDDVKEKKPDADAEEKVSKADEKSIEENLSYMRLDLIKGENFEAKNTNVTEGEEIGKVSNSLFEKIAAADDKARIDVLKSLPDINDFELEFEIEDVSVEALALESAQNTSIENPESFLTRMEVQINDIADANLNQIKTEKSSIASVSSETPKKLTVTDLRTQKSDNEISVAKLDDAEPKLKVNTVIDGSDSATITMDLNQSAQNAANDVLSLNSQAASADGSNFQAMLNNQIQANATEFVKASNIILKDNDKGTINLVLHPDDLGDVKFHLSLDGNKITGHIVVNTKEALQVFKDNAQTLREAFIKSGFENAGFEVSYNSNGSGGNGEFEQQRQNQNNFFAKREYGVLNEVVAVQNFSSGNEDFGEFNINIVA